MRLLAALVVVCSANAAYFDLSYPASTDPGELRYAATYRMWVPSGGRKVRAVVVHQHGCGAGASVGGTTAADDLHWQALAAKWDAVLIAPSYKQPDGQDCRLWSDPRNGSEKTFLRALEDFASKAGWSEIREAPWVLWGHSGGGFWVGLMSMLHPERVVGVWLRSGAPAFEPEIPAAVYSIPMMANAGVKEQHDRFKGAWENALNWHKRLRAKGAPVGFAPDPRTSHETGDSRYLAIPFFDACLAMRLPSRPGGALKPVDSSRAWLGTLLGDSAVAADRFNGNVAESVWLPNEQIARAWVEFVKTGAVDDHTPPPPPSRVTAKRTGDSVEITWDAEADFDSGIRAFVVERDGVEVAQVPPAPAGRFGRPLFQAMSYHDTPATPLPAMRYSDTGVPSRKHRYRVLTINSVGLKSRPSKVAEVR